MLERSSYAVDRDPEDGWFRNEMGTLVFMFPTDADADMNWPDTITLTVEPGNTLSAPRHEIDVDGGCSACEGVH